LAIQFRKAEDSKDYADIFPLVQLLNPELTQEQFDIYLKDMLEAGNYFLVRLEEDGQLLGISGYWLATKFYCGRYLEIDNLVIDPAHRNKGLGEQLIEWLETEARREKCDTIMLDAYVENFDAHRFYYRHGFKGRGFHHLKHL